MYKAVLSALLQHGWAQLGLMEECRKRAESARDPRLCSAWTGVFLRLSRALTGTAEVLARMEAAPAILVEALPRAGLRQPELPDLPDAREGPSPFEKLENNLGRFFEHPQQFAPSSFLPRKRGRKENARLRTKSKGGAPRGNRNAQKAGCYTAELHAFRR